MLIVELKFSMKCSTLNITRLYITSSWISKYFPKCWEFIKLCFSLVKLLKFKGREKGISGKFAQKNKVKLFLNFLLFDDEYLKLSCKAMKCEKKNFFKREELKWKNWKIWTKHGNSVMRVVEVESKEREKEQENSLEYRLRSETWLEGKSFPGENKMWKAHAKVHFFPKPKSFAGDVNHHSPKFNFIRDHCFASSFSLTLSLNETQIGFVFEESFFVERKKVLEEI